MKLYRVVAYVINLNGDCDTKEHVAIHLRNVRHPEFIQVTQVNETDCGEWDDTHELNYTNAPYDKYFPECNPSLNEEELRKHIRVFNERCLQEMDKKEALEREVAGLRKEIEKLKKVQEFVKTIGGIIR